LPIPGTIATLGTPAGVTPNTFSAKNASKVAVIIGGIKRKGGDAT